MATIRDALEQGILTLTKAGQDQVKARLDAQVLLSHTLQVERSVLYAHPERILTPEQEQQFFTLIERRSRGEPVAYLTGHKEFYGLHFLVAKLALIPPPHPDFPAHPAQN